MHTAGTDQPVIVGSGEFRYQALADWAKLPEGWTFYEIGGVATDSRDRAYVFNRSEHPLMVFEADGTFLRSWGEGTFVNAHGITIGPDDMLYLTDDHDHTVRKFTPDGKLLLTLGVSGKPSDTGVVGLDYRTIRPGIGPFNRPTNLVLDAQGDMYITDGYGNARVHKYSADGKLLFSWGTPGDGRGEFNLPHGIAIDSEGLIYVCDRENNRIQIFTPAGEYVSEWNDIARPCQIFFDPQDRAFIAEVGWRAGLFAWTTAPYAGARGGNVSVFDKTGNLLVRWGGGENPCATGDFFAPHDITLDSTGSIYVGEVVMSAGGKRGLVPPTCHSLQKFVRV